MTSREQQNSNKENLKDSIKVVSFSMTYKSLTKKCFGISSRLYYFSLMNIIKTEIDRGFVPKRISKPGLKGTSVAYTPLSEESVTYLEDFMKRIADELEEIPATTEEQMERFFEYIKSMTDEDNNC